MRSEDAQYKCEESLNALGINVICKPKNFFAERETLYNALPFIFLVYLGDIILPRSSK